MPLPLTPTGHAYPAADITVEPFTPDLKLLPEPAGLLGDDWPPVQVGYLASYLQQLGCQTLVIESHYIDRDYMADVALLYTRNLRSYPNYCYRVHFFSEKFDQVGWASFIADANKGRLEKVEQRLNAAYLGFSVIRPLPGYPVGRTVLTTYKTKPLNGQTRQFDATRDYDLQLAGFKLRVHGLAFQQQDQGVSACATTAVWSAMHAVAHRERLALPTPADITQAASRFLAGGRSLPSEGLSVFQICEAIRAHGLAPVMVGESQLETHRAHVHAYLRSGFAPVLAIRMLNGNVGHAICAVGMKLDAPDIQTDPNLKFKDKSTELKALYVHDDRLGPYAVAELYPYSVKRAADEPAVPPRMGIQVRWPIPGEDAVWEYAVVTALIVPVPVKIRLGVNRLREVGLAAADALGHLLPEKFGTVLFSCRYATGTDYRRSTFEFGLSDEAIQVLQNKLPLSRYIGLLEISTDKGPFMDVLVDATEMHANPSVLACVLRLSLEDAVLEDVRALATALGGMFLK